MIINSEIKGSVIIVRPSGRTDFMASGETERSILDTIEKERERHLLINLENIDYLHSSGIRMILSLKMKLEETGRSLLLSNINGDIRKILEFVDILDLIKVFENEEDALSGCAPGEA
jgi:anti-anti-sigma factor